MSRVLDRAVGRVLDVYERKGVLERTYVLFIADHGHTPVSDDDHHALGHGGDDEPTSLIEQMGFRMRPFELDPENGRQDYTATVAYQGAMAYVYLADRSRCPESSPCDWKQAPPFEQEVMPLVRAFFEANVSGKRVPALEGTLDLILTRRPQPVGHDAEAFQVFDGQGLVGIGEYLRRHPRPDLLDFERRMRWLAEGPQGHRAGDILLLAKSGEQRPIEERFYFSGPYHSWHGSPSAQDSNVPLVLARPGVPAARLQTLVRDSLGDRRTVLAIVPLIERLLRERAQ